MCLRVYVCMYVCRSVMNVSAVAVVIKMIATMTWMTTIMMMSIMTSSTHTVASQLQPLTYRPIYAPNGTRLCAVTDPYLPFQTIMFDKLTSCALHAMTSQSVMFNYKANLTNSECTLFQSPPLSYQQSDNCTGYEVIARFAISNNEILKTLNTSV